LLNKLKALVRGLLVGKNVLEVLMGSDVRTFIENSEKVFMEREERRKRKKMK
jgi:hypothetical protein